MPAKFLQKLSLTYINLLETSGFFWNQKNNSLVRLRCCLFCICSVAALQKKNYISVTGNKTGFTYILLRKDWFIFPPCKIRSKKMGAKRRWVDLHVCCLRAQFLNPLYQISEKYKCDLPLSSQYIQQIYVTVKYFL